MHSAFLAAGHDENPLIPGIADIVLSIVPFAIILWLFWKVVLPKLNVMLDERSAAIEGNIEKADEANRQAEQLLAEYRKQLDDARNEASEIREQAREDAKRIAVEIREQAAADAERITQNAHAQIEAERSAALTSLRREVGTLALDLAGRVVGDSMKDDKRASVVVDGFLRDLDASKGQKA